MNEQGFIRDRFVLPDPEKKVEGSEFQVTMFQKRFEVPAQQPDHSVVADIRQAHDTLDAIDLRTHPQYTFFTEHIPAALLERLSTKELAKLLRDCQSEFEANPELKKMYHDILIEGDVQALREKTKVQVQKMKEKYLGGSPIKRFFERRQLQKKLAEFQKTVHAFQVVRSDRADFEHSEFLSPRSLEKAQSYGAQDVLAQADRYVYASFDKTPHFMAAGGTQYLLDDSDFQDRAEIVMQDIANIRARSEDGKNFLAKYINNIFDYKQGKELLALYLAYVFETPQEAELFLKNNNHPMTAQGWDRQGSTYYNLDPLSLEEEKKLATLDPSSQQEFLEQKKIRAQKRQQDILAKMQELLQEFGFEPPLSLEVRIPDFASVRGKF